MWGKNEQPITDYKRLGYSDNWIIQRQNIEIRKFKNPRQCWTTLSGKTFTAISMFNIGISLILRMICSSIKTCPKCQNKFESSISEKISEHNTLPFQDLDCLCPNCANESKKTKKINYKVIQDYYFDEQGNCVFTAAYHLQRGYCCRNNCRHCPY